MAGVKPRNFDVATEFPASMAYYYQPAAGDEVQVPHSLLLTQLGEDGVVIDPGTVVKTNTQTISVAAGTLVVALVLTPSATLTVSVGTSAAGTQVIDNVEINSETVFVVNKHFAASGTLHFTLSTGSVTVHLKKL